MGAPWNDEEQRRYMRMALDQARMAMEHEEVTVLTMIATYGAWVA